MNKELEFKEVETWDDNAEFVEITPNARLYYKIRTYDGSFEDNVGFDFVGLKCTGWPCDGENEYNFSPQSTVEVVVEGIGLFDGVRHLYYGSEKSNNFGYHYYSSIPLTIKFLTELRKLEELYCSEFEN